MTIPILDHPLTVDEAVNRLYFDMSLNDEMLLVSTNEKDLIDVRFSIGYRIRHEFGLWTGNDALLESCRIIAGDENLHVDDASMVIIKALWEKVKEKYILQD